MLKLILAFLKTYLLPAVKIAVAEAVVNQIEDATYGPRGYGRRLPGSYGRRQYGPRSTRLPRD